MQDAPAGFSSPAEKKQQADRLEQLLRRVKAQAAARSSAVEAHIKDIRTHERDAWAELEARFQLADAKVQSTEEEAQSARMEAEAKIQSADKAVEEAKEYRLLCEIELNTRKEYGSGAIHQAEKNQREWLARADVRIQMYQKSLDKARQEEMTPDASSAGDSG